MQSLSEFCSTTSVPLAKESLLLLSTLQTMTTKGANVNCIVLVPFTLAFYLSNTRPLEHNIQPLVRCVLAWMQLVVVCCRPLQTAQQQVHPYQQVANWRPLFLSPSQWHSSALELGLGWPNPKRVAVSRGEEGDLMQCLKLISLLCALTFK